MVSITQNTITLVKGDTVILELEITKDYDVVDLTGSQAFLTVKENINDENASAVFSIPIFAHPDQDLLNGIIHFKIEHTHTNILKNKKYVYDISVIDSNNEYHTLMRGDFYLLSDIKNS